MLSLAQNLAKNLNLFATSKTLLLTLAALVVVSVVGVTVGYASINQEMTLTLDGKSTSIRSTGETVAEVLEDEGIEIGDHDMVAPGLDEKVDEGSAITVRFGRPLEVNLDGAQQTYWVTATDVDSALSEIGQRFLGASLSTSRGASIGRGGMDLTIVTPKKVTLKVGREERTTETVAGLTVADVLDALEVKYDDNDIVRPALDAVVDDGTRITVVKVRIVTRSVTDEVVHYETVERPDSSAFKGETETLREGIDGRRNATYRLEFRNGELFATKVVSAEVTKESTDAIVKVGTKEVAANFAGGSTVWDRLAQCESGGDWSINTGNGYYGGLQFSASTWHAYGGSGLPHQNSRAEQIRIAEKLRAATGGYGSWPGCASKLGLPR